MKLVSRLATSLLGYVILALTPPVATSQTPLARLDLLLGGPADAPQLSGTNLGTGAITFDSGKPFTIAISCTALDCTKISFAPGATGSAKDFIKSAANATSAGVVIPSGPPDPTFELVIAYSGKALTPKLALTGKQVTTDQTNTGRSSTTAPLKLRIRNKGCSSRVDVPEDADYALWLDGTPIASPKQPPHEGQKLVFYVFGESGLVNGQTVLTRKSATRTIVVSNILGSGTPVTGVSDLNRQGLIQCSSLRVVLSDFAAGTGEVEISVINEDASAEEKNTFDFAVAALYTGSYQFGAIYTNSSSPAFAKVFNGADTVVAKTSDGKRLLYTLTYTPFVWGRRDVTQPPARWWQSIYPLFGVVLNDIPNNGLAGLSYDFGSMFSVNAGLHAAHIDELDAASNANVGGAFDNRGATIPTVKRWSFNVFYGISIDLAGALGLLKTASGAAATSGK